MRKNHENSPGGISMKSKSFVIVFLLAAAALLNIHPPSTEAKDRISPRQRVANQLNQIRYLRGDHLHYSQKFLGYLYEKYKIEPTGPINQFLLTNRSRRFRRGRQSDFNYYDLLSGGLAIRESLQVDTISASGDNESLVPVSSLKGPEVASHPFKEMMKGRKFKAYPLAAIAPEDFYYFHFSNMAKALDFFDYMNQVGGALYQRAAPKAVDFMVKKKVLTQLAIVENRWARKFYDHVIGEMAVVGSDPFMRLGSDVSFIYKLKHPSVFFKKIDGYRNEFIKKYKATSSSLAIRGKKVRLIKSRSRKVCSYLVKLDKKTVVISNSLSAVKVVIATYNKKHPSLAKADDFQYMRSIYSAGDQKEDAFLYLSDSFIRYLVGPKSRISEARRLHEALRIADLERHGLFYYQLYGKKAADLRDLEREFGPEVVEKFSGLTFEKTSFAAVSKRFGKMGYFTPNIDIELPSVSKKEADDYNRFLRGYNNYWREYFDPVGIRIMQKGGRTRMETCILPLINNSIYNSLTQLFGGSPVVLQTGKTRVPGEILSITGKISGKMMNQPLFRNVRMKDKKLINLKPADIFLNRVKIGMLDAKPMVDFDASKLMNVFSGSRFRSRYILPVIGAWSLFHPLSITVPLRDPKQSRKEIDRIESLTLQLSRAIGNDFAVDRYYIKHKGKKINVTKFSFFDILKFRIFTTVHEGSYVMTSTDEYMYRILDESKSDGEGSVKGNIQAVIRPAGIKKEKSMYVLNMMESAREASLNNYGTYKLFSMIFKVKKNLNELAFESFVFHLQCPSGGKYSFDRETGRVINSVYGDGGSGIISLKELLKGDAFQRFFSTEQILLNLEFTPEGIKTVVDIK